MNMVSEQASHPLAINSESLLRLAHWLKSDRTPREAKPDRRRMMVERYPAGLLSEAELDALWSVTEG